MDSWIDSNVSLIRRVGFVMFLASITAPISVADEVGDHLEQQTTESTSVSALFFVQNGEVGSSIRPIESLGILLEVETVTDVDSFLEKASMRRSGWDLVAVMIDSTDVNDPDLVEYVSSILASISLNQGGVQLFITEQIAQGDADQDDLFQLRVKSWAGDAYLDAIFAAEGGHEALESVGDTQMLVGVGGHLNDNRAAFLSNSNDERLDRSLIDDPDPISDSNASSNVVPFQDECIAEAEIEKTFCKLNCQDAPQTYPIPESRAPCREQCRLNFRDTRRVCLMIGAYLEVW